MTAKEYVESLHRKYRRLAQRNRYGRIDRRHARTEEPEYRQNRRDA